MKTIKISQLIVFFSLLVISCSSNQKNVDVTVQDKESFTETFSNIKETTTAAENQFEEVQDSLRQVLLDSKSNENLKAGLLQEFYLRALVDQKEDKIFFNLPFNIHGLDCGAPDCYSTDISFSIALSEPLEFPDKVDFKLIEQGCMDKEEAKNSVFILKEESQDYLNYFSEELKSNLIIKRNGDLYYYPHLKSNSINTETIDEMFETNGFDDADIVPYQSTVMTSNDYQQFIKHKRPS